MEIANKNIVVLPELCKKCDNDCFRIECQLCRPCFTSETKLILTQSYLEHQNRMDFQRIFPPPIVSHVFSINHLDSNWMNFLDERYDAEKLHPEKSITY